MRKSEIVAAIVSARSKKKVPTEKQITKELTGSLAGLSLNTGQWDTEVDKEIAQLMIKHLSAVNGQLTIRDLILDIDLILKRIS